MHREQRLMTTLRPPAINEIEYATDASYFFRRLGEITLGIDATSVANSRNASKLAVASQNGVIIFCQNGGENATQMRLIIIRL